MLRSTLAITSLLLSLSAMTQNAVRFDINSLPEYHSSASNIYIAGSFNGWNPQDDAYKFKQDDKGHYFLNLKLTPGIYEYKITRGSWDKVECRKGGAGVDNHTLKVENDLAIQLNIEEWQDRFPAKPRVSTASKNVHVIDTAFLIPQLNRVRRVWIYLPEAYQTTRRSEFPVLYMQDGQNVFDDATSYSGEWGVDEFLDSTQARECIVVAVDHGASKRINEYCPYDMEKFGKGEGDQYLDFIVKTLKPFIDKNYRTLKDKKNTFIAGSSMGGLISMYAILKYPDVFGGAGVFSPAFWVGPKIFEDIQAKGKNVMSNIYFYAGKLEGESMVPDMEKAYKEMKAISSSRMESVVREDGKHNEPTWRQEFPLFYKWIMK